ncbi:MAG: hypothetical protein AB7E47_15585 [Desulfovibrionaceae bacterium]
MPSLRLFPLLACLLLVCVSCAKQYTQKDRDAASTAVASKLRGVPDGAVGDHLVDLLMTSVAPLERKEILGRFSTLDNAEKYVPFLMSTLDDVREVSFQAVDVLGKIGYFPLNLEFGGDAYKDISPFLRKALQHKKMLYKDIFAVHGGSANKVTCNVLSYEVSGQASFCEFTILYNEKSIARASVSESKNYNPNFNMDPWSTYIDHEQAVAYRLLDEILSYLNLYYLEKIRGE